MIDTVRIYLAELALYVAVRVAPETPSGDRLVAAVARYVDTEMRANPNLETP